MNPAFWEADLGVGLGPLLLGLPREEILRRAAAEGLAPPDGEDDPTSAYFDDAGLDLYFRPESPHALWQIGVTDERLRFGGLPVIDRPVHKIVGLLKVPPEETLWRDGSDPEDCLPENEKPATGAAAALDLLDFGVLWFTTLGLGVETDQATVLGVYLRQPEDSPRTGVGSWTEEQRIYSADPELAGKVRQNRRRMTVFGAPPTSWRWAVNLVGMLAAAWVVWSAFQLQQRWNNATVVQAEVIAVEPPPPDPFPEAATVAYSDLKGRRHEIRLERNDFYVIQGVGDTIELRYLPEAPGHPLGPVKSRDIGFDYAVPRVGAVLAAIAGLQLVGGFFFRR